MTEIILAAGGIIAVAAYILAIVVLIVDELVVRSIALARMVAGVAHMNPVKVSQCDGSPS